MEADTTIFTEIRDKRVVGRCAKFWRLLRRKRNNRFRLSADFNEKTCRISDLVEYNNTALVMPEKTQFGGHHGVILRQKRGESDEDYVLRKRELNQLTSDSGYCDSIGFIGNNQF